MCTWNARPQRLFCWQVFLLLALAFALTAPAGAAPKQIQLTYAVHNDDHLMAHIQESYTQTGRQYRILSVTNGVGVYALLGKRTLVSEGKVGKAGLQPARFEFLQSKNPAKALINSFDWQHKQLHLQVKGETKQEPLEMGTQDLLSAMYQFMHLPPHGTDLNVAVTNGKRIKVQQYTVSSVPEKLQTEAGEFNVIQLSEAQTAEKTIFLAKDKFYLPVKMIVKEDSQTLVQILVNIKITP